MKGSRQSLESRFSIMAACLSEAIDNVRLLLEITAPGSEPVQLRLRELSDMCYSLVDLQRAGFVAEHANVLDIPSSPVPSKNGE